ncbi:hypothetical protein B0H14DRAFT_3576198 [Mycena olivaceomarginata]|nr:hypothetical protein B0H14DRAFT_3576198 [Mycena olivaceomarginata]
MTGFLNVEAGSRASAARPSLSTYGWLIVALVFIQRPDAEIIRAADHELYPPRLMIVLGGYDGRDFGHDRCLNIHNATPRRAKQLIVWEPPVKMPSHASCRRPMPPRVRCFHLASCVGRTCPLLDSVRVNVSHERTTELKSRRDVLYMLECLDEMQTRYSGRSRSSSTHPATSSSLPSPPPFTAVSYAGSVLLFPILTSATEPRDSRRAICQKEGGGELPPVYHDARLLHADVRPLLQQPVLLECDVAGVPAGRSFHRVHEEQPHTHPQRYEPDAGSVSVSSLYPAGADIELHTPASATSGIGARPPAARRVGGVLESEGEGEWTLTSDSHSMHLEPLPHKREHEQEGKAAARGQAFV